MPSSKALAFRGDDDDDRDMLESLNNLSIRGFSNFNDTPSSTSASLPIATPPALKTFNVFLAAPERPFGGTGWFTPDRPLPQPNAPLMKDLDSFTEGTGQGSFDFPLASGDDEAPMLPLIFHPPENVDTTPISPDHSPMTNSLALYLLPEPGNSNEAVLAWIEGVSSISSSSQPSSSQPPPKKRRRSLTQDDETEDRRTRAWSPIIDSSSSHADVREPHDNPEPNPPG